MGWAAGLGGMEGKEKKGGKRCREVEDEGEPLNFNPVVQKIE